MRRVSCSRKSKKINSYILVTNMHIKGYTGDVQPYLSPLGREEISDLRGYFAQRTELNLT